MDKLRAAAQAVATLQLSLKTIKDWLRVATLTSCKIRHLWRVEEADFEALIQTSRVLRARGEYMNPVRTDAGGEFPKDINSPPI
jgi:hypothetical protein